MDNLFLTGASTRGLGRDGHYDGAVDGREVGTQLSLPEILHPARSKPVRENDEAFEERRPNFSATMAGGVEDSPGATFHGHHGPGRDQGRAIRPCVALGV